MKLVKREDHWALYNEDGHKIAATLPGCNSKLSIKNCEAIANGYDLDELADEYYSKLEVVPYKSNGFKSGFQKALELLGDKKYSVLDIQNVIDSNEDSLVYQTISENGDISFCLDEDVLIQSLQQTEFDVEILMGTNYRHIDCVNEGEFVTSKIVKDNEAPMLDKNNCLILKRI